MALSSLRPAARSKGYTSPSADELVDFVRPRQRVAGPEPAAVQRRDPMGVAQHIVDVRVGPRTQPAGNESGAERVAGTGGVFDVHVEGRGADLLPIHEGQTAL